MINGKLILASQSPRRRQLVTCLFSKISTIDMKNFDEPRWKKNEKPLQYLVKCVEEKWQTALGRLGKNTVSRGSFLLVADTIVELNDQVFGKPENKADAVKILSKLSGKTHRVWTGYALGRLGPEKHFDVIYSHVRSDVKFRKLNKAQIKAYVDTGEPMDKAGAYGFQGIGIQLIESVEGSYTNIVGLPLESIRNSAEQLGAKI